MPNGGNRAVNLTGDMTALGRDLPMTESRRPVALQSVLDDDGWASRNQPLTFTI